MRPGYHDKFGRLGVTLIELMIVIALIGMFAAIAMPQLLPVIGSSTHEGAARHLVGFGRAAMSRAVILQGELIVKVDLDNQEYWCEEWPEVDYTGEEEVGLVDEDGDLPDDPMELLALTQSTLRGEDEEMTQERAERVVDKQKRRMRDSFYNRSRRSLTTRANRVKHDSQGILGDAGDLLGDEFRLDREGLEIAPNEISGPLLQRTAMPDGVFIEYVIVGGVEHEKGVVEIELTALGLDSEVTFFVVNDEGDIYTVEWDPVAVSARMHSPEGN